MPRGRLGNGSDLSAEMKVVCSESEDEERRSASRASGRGSALGTVGARGTGAGRRCSPWPPRPRPSSVSAHAHPCHWAAGSSPVQGPLFVDWSSPLPSTFPQGFKISTRRFGCWPSPQCRRWVAAAPACLFHARCGPCPGGETGPPHRGGRVSPGGPASAGDACGPGRPSDEPCGPRETGVCEPCVRGCVHVCA